MSESHQREAAIFDAAMELPHGQRAAHLDHACGGDAALRQRIESLLKACESKCEFLDSPTDPAAANTMNALPPSFEKAGDKIGRYKLLQQIGEGGCGVVYMAEQEEPVSRRVALKVIKLGMDTKSVVARFEAERQALALMDHPNIAKVLDGGATETGRPYFVMELVRGMKITEYCDEARLSTNARLDLFIQVCQAIQHAHQKGIIHRDIKPSNILVTINDGVPVPKVIDFGVAKATGGLKLTNKTVFTAFEQFIGTPAYMSPEQAVLTSLDIDTRSDIYALGVLLYELLTGKTPFDAKELLAIGLDEMRRTIREQEPPRPSTRLSTLAQNELSTTAQRRGLDAPKLVSELRGDLDWIVMKALEKDRARRYETANGLAMDIQRHLSNEPVVACPPSKLYRFQKTVQRNKLAFAASAAVSMALVIGIIVSMWQAARASRAERAAKEEKDSAEAVLTFVRDRVLAAGRPEGQEGGLGKDVTLRKAIDAAEPQISESFQNRPLVEAAIRQTLGDSYSYLGEPALAVRQLERALALHRQHLGPEHRATLGSMNLLALTYGDAGKLDQALRLHEETLKLRKAKLGPDHPDTIGSMINLATAYMSAGKLDQALPLLEESLKLAKAKLGLEHPFTLNSMNSLALTYREAGKFDQALPLFEEEFKLRKAKLGPEHPDTLNSMNNLGLAYENAGNMDQAVRLHEETLKLRKAKLGPEHPRTLGSMNNLAAAYLNAGKLDQALALYQETFELQNAKLGPEHPDTLNSMNGLAAAYMIAGKLHQALPLFEEAFKLCKAKLGPDHPHTLVGMGNLAAAYFNAGKLDQALALYQETFELQKAKLGPEHLHTLATMGRLVDGRARRAQFAEAAADLIQVRDANPGDHMVWHQLAPLLVASGQLEVYREHCRKSVERFGKSSDPETAERIAKDCLILPASGVDLNVVAKMADTAAAVTNHMYTPWFQLVKGLAEYRQVRFASAIEWMNKALTETGKELRRDVQAYMVLAMAHYQLKQTDEARAAFAIGADLARTNLPKLESGDLGGHWLDWIIAHALMREAKALIEGASEIKAETK